MTGFTVLHFNCKQLCLIELCNDFCVWLSITDLLLTGYYLKLDLLNSGFLVLDFSSNIFTFKMGNPLSGRHVAEMMRNLCKLS